MIVTVDVLPQTGQSLIALATESGVPVARVAGAILDSEVGYKLEIARMGRGVQEATTDYYGCGAGFPQGGDA